MKTPVDVLLSVAGVGGQLGIAGDNLLTRLPRDCPHELKEAIRQHKLALLRLLQLNFLVVRSDPVGVTLLWTPDDRYKEWRLSGGFFADDGEQERRKRMARMKKGTRSVDLELTILASVFHLAVRRTVLKANPLAGRARYSVAEDIRHCREVAPTPAGLKQIEYWLRARNEQSAADVVCFLAYSGLRIGEALPLDWEAVDWSAKVLHVKREKRGILPWVPILPAMEALLRDMQTRANSHLLFPSPFESDKQRDRSAIGHRLAAACKGLSFGHVTPHGLRSYFVTQARESGLSDAEIAMLIGDKTGPAIIAQTYGDVRPEHLLKQAQRIRLTVQEIREASDKPSAGGSSIKSSNTSPDVSECLKATPDIVESAEVTTDVEDEQDLARRSDTSRNNVAATLNQLVPGSSPGRGTSPPSTCAREDLRAAPE